MNFLGKKLVIKSNKVGFIEDFENLRKLFQKDAKELYNSVVGKKWMKEYGGKKGKSCTKISHISNPYRKEIVGNYFYKKRGYFD